MGAAKKETENPRPLFTDITNIQFIPTEGKPDEITAQISRKIPPVEEIRLGVSEKAIGHLRLLGIKNLAWTICKGVVGAVLLNDGVTRFLGTPGINIVAGSEAVAGGLIMTYSFIKMVQRLSTLDTIEAQLDQKRTGS